MQYSVLLEQPTVFAQIKNCRLPRPETSATLEKAIFHIVME